MKPTAAAIRDALDSGETDRVNAAIDAVDDLEPTEAIERFDTVREVCENCYQSGDGYQRQAAVRVIDAFGTAWIGLDTAGLAPEPAIASARQTCWAFLLDAVRDEDGRVRQSAVLAVRTLETATRIAEADAEWQAAYEGFTEARASVEDDAIVDDIEEAIDRFTRFPSPIR